VLVEASSVSDSFLLSRHHPSRVSCFSGFFIRANISIVCLIFSSFSEIVCQGVQRTSPWVHSWILWSMFWFCIMEVFFVHDDCFSSSHSFFCSVVIERDLCLGHCSRGSNAKAAMISSA